MGADATLVNMAYRAAMAKKPGDWSKSFDKQYEGIIAANEALASIGSEFIGAVKDVKVAQIERNKDEEEKFRETLGSEYAYTIAEAQQLDKYKNDAADTLITNNSKIFTYENGEGLNASIRKAAYDVPANIYNNITETNKKIWKSKEDKQYIAEQYARLESWKSDRIKDKANVKQLSNAINSGLVNLKNMDPEYKALLAQIIDGKADLSEKGIRIYNRESDDKLMVEFTPNRMESEAEYNKRMQEVDGGPSAYQTQPVAPYQGQTYVEQKAGLQSVSFDDLMGNVNYRELELQGDLVEVVGGVSVIAGAMHTKSKAFITSEWDDGSVNSGKAQLTRSVNNLFAGKGRKEIADLATTDFFGTGTGSTYRDNLTNLVGGMDLSAMGLVDEGNPGYEDDMKDSLLREEIIGRLINPKTPSDEKFALQQMKDYYIDMGKGIFNTTRTALVNEQNEIKNRASGRTKTTETTPKTVDLPWQKGLKKPTNIQATASHDLVQEILNEQGEVKDGNDVYTRQKDGTYKLTHEISGGKRSPISGGEVRTKVSMIQLGGGIYGNIPDDYFDIMFIDTDPENPSTLVTPDIETSKYLEDLKTFKNVDASKL